jgi:DNA repair protein RecN (Recombination protein N)
MLKSLAISNFAVIHQLSVEFHPGLNVITGETGAGKSILVDALGLLLGGRGSAELLRTGEDRLRVEALFDLPTGGKAARWLAERFPGQADGGEVVVRRELGRDGRSRAWVGASPATLSALREAASTLIEIQGQHEQQGLLVAAAQRDWLDAFAGLGEGREAVERAYRAMSELEQRVQRADSAERDRLQRLDLLRFQIDEVAQVDPRPGEDEELRARRDRIRHAERLRQAAAEALRTLHEDDLSAAALVGRARSRLQEIAALDPGCALGGETLEPMAAALGEVARELSSYLDGLEVDPTELERVEERRQAIESLKRKYGGSVEEVLELAARRRQELEDLERSALGREEDVRHLEEESRRYWQAAETLSRARRRAAQDLCARVERELGALAMRGARFRVEIRTPPPPWPPQARPPAGAAGADEVEFHIAPNVGEEARPLARIASGGELSRLLLALHVSQESEAGPRTLVYDEVDAGVGAEVAIAVGERLRRVARRHQVLCVTHLHPIAAAADHHFTIDKRAERGRTEVRIRELDAAERVEEILRMLGGRQAGEAGRRAAAEWLRKREATPSGGS